MLQSVRLEAGRLRTQRLEPGLLGKQARGLHTKPGRLRLLTSRKARGLWLLESWRSLTRESRRLRGNATLRETWLKSGLELLLLLRIKAGL